MKPKRAAVRTTRRRKWHGRCRWQVRGFYAYFSFTNQPVWTDHGWDHNGQVGADDCFGRQLPKASMETQRNSLRKIAK